MAKGNAIAFRDVFAVLPSLKVTAKAPENPWLEGDISFWGPAYFQGSTTMLISGSVYIYIYVYNI